VSRGWLGHSGVRANKGRLKGLGGYHDLASRLYGLV
jgi:hypothetical protein